MLGGEYAENDGEQGFAKKWFCKEINLIAEYCLKIIVTLVFLI